MPVLSRGRRRSRHQARGLLAAHPSASRPASPTDCFAALVALLLLPMVYPSSMLCAHWSFHFPRGLGLRECIRGLVALCFFFCTVWIGRLSIIDRASACAAICFSARFSLGSDRTYSARLMALCIAKENTNNANNIHMTSPST